MTTNEIRAAEACHPSMAATNCNTVKKDENGQTVETSYATTPGTGRRQASQKAEESGESPQYLYDVIVSDDYWGGISAEKFVKELNALKLPTIHLRINSPGGEGVRRRGGKPLKRPYGTIRRGLLPMDGHARQARLPSWRVSVTSGISPAGSS